MNVFSIYKQYKIFFVKRNQQNTKTNESLSTYMCTRFLCNWIANKVNQISESIIITTTPIKNNKKKMNAKRCLKKPNVCKLNILQVYTLSFFLYKSVCSFSLSLTCALSACLNAFYLQKKNKLN